MKKTLNECLDHVLQILMEAKDGYLNHYIQNEKGLAIPTNLYNKLFTPLQLTNGEFCELLNILLEKGYIEYQTIIEKEYVTILDIDGINAGIVSVNTKNNTDLIHLHNYGLKRTDIFLEPDYIWLKLKGKFYFEQGGFQGEENKKNAEKDRIKRQDEQIRLLTFFLAIGSIGVLIIEALKFILDYIL